MPSCIYIVAVLVTSIGLSSAAPWRGEKMSDPEWQDDLTEGDMILSPEQSSAIRNPWARNGLSSASYRWRNSIVYYRICSTIDAEHVAYIHQAMSIIEANTCTRFVPHNSPSAVYVNITGFDEGCYSYVGCLNRVQQLNLQLHPVGYGCYRIGTVMHELIHALGFFHMQSAADRDEFVDVKPENMQSGTEHNFQKYSPYFVSSFGVPYDYGSVMHYPRRAFSKNGRETIVPKDPTASIGQRSGMSAGDIEKINIMYSCVGK